ncbi:MAG: adenylate kinase [Bdellovibrionota bacterium]
MRVVFLGPPGAGKGTQAKMLSSDAKLAHISTGDMLRAAVAEGSDLGKRVQSIMDSGQLVPDDLIIDIIRERIAKPDATAGYILDGFPRTVKQAEALTAMLAKQGAAIDAVVSFELDETELLSRLANRRGAESRADDDVTVQKERLRVYKEQTEPLIEFYGSRGALRKVDASGSVDQVFQGLKQAVGR